MNLRLVVREMRVGPSGPVGRGGFQTTGCCCGPRVVVVSDLGKGGAGLHQVRSGKANESEPLMTCRKSTDAVETELDKMARDEAWGMSVSCPGGGRHIGGASPDQALVRNVGTCRFDAKGEPASGGPTKGRVPMRSGGADRLVVVMKPGNVGGAKGSTCPAETASQLARGGARGRSKAV